MTDQAPPLSRQPKYVVYYTDRRGAKCSQTTCSKSAVHKCLEKLSRRRIAAEAYDQTEPGERILIGESWKNEGKWTWCCEN